VNRLAYSEAPAPEAVPPPVNVFNHVPGVEGGPGLRGSWLTVKAAEPAQEALTDGFVDLIACERECRSCSYAMTLDCDGNCGVCPHNGYCPCVNPVVARSKTALRIIELRPIMLQELRTRAEVIAG
jgi:hypothetical protein